MRAYFGVKLVLLAVFIEVYVCMVGEGTPACGCVYMHVHNYIRNVYKYIEHHHHQHFSPCDSRQWRRITAIPVCSHHSSYGKAKLKGTNSSQSHQHAFHTTLLPLFLLHFPIHLRRYMPLFHAGASWDTELNPKVFFFTFSASVHLYFSVSFSPPPLMNYAWIREYTIVHYAITFLMGTFV